MFVMYTADRVIATLRAHETELRQAGLRSLSLFGSVARGETETASDIDLAAEFDPADPVRLFLALLWRKTSNGSWSSIQAIKARFAAMSKPPAFGL